MLHLSKESVLRIVKEKMRSQNTSDDKVANETEKHNCRCFNGRIAVVDSRTADVSVTIHECDSTFPRKSEVKGRGLFDGRKPVRVDEEKLCSERCTV